MRFVRHFLDALSFFTCLVPARMVSGSSLAQCAPFLFPCGLVLGSAASLGAALALAFLDGHALPCPLPALVAALVWLVAEILLSRGLHWDAVADMADALGSYREGEAFRAVLKDSRLGTFGALALIVVFAGQFLALAGHLTQGQWLVLILAPAWGKNSAFWLLSLAQPYDRRSLGGKFAEAGSRQNMALCLFLTLCSLLALFCSGISLTGLAMLCLFQALLIGKFVFWSRHYGGYSGDFIGALMETSQCLCLVCTL